MAVGVSGDKAKEVIGEGWARILCVGFTVEDDWVIAEKSSAAVRPNTASTAILTGVVESQVSILTTNNNDRHRRVTQSRVDLRI